MVVLCIVAWRDLAHALLQKKLETYDDAEQEMMLAVDEDALKYVESYRILSKLPNPWDSLGGIPNCRARHHPARACVYLWS